MNKVAVVLLNWNGEKILPIFLPSVVENSYDAEIYLIDNGSNDSSLEYVRKNFPLIKIIELDKNYGFAGGYNKGLKEIKAEYFILLNTDVKVSEGWISPIIEFMDKNSNIAAVQPKILSYTNPKRFEYAGASGGFIDKWGYPLARGRIFNIVEEDKGQYDDIRPIFWASGAAMFVRSELFFRVGGFDSDFFAHMEEIDLCWRLKNIGKEIYVFPKVKVFHLGGGTLSYQNPRKIYYNFRNSLFMLIKNLPSRQVFIKILWRLILDFLAAINFLINKPRSGAWQITKAHIYFYKNLNKLIKKRKHYKKVNKFNYSEILNKSIIWQFYFRKKQKFSEIVD